MTIKNTLLTTDYISSYLSAIDINARNMQTSFYNIFDTVNDLYNEASASEDAISVSFLNMVQKLNSIKFTYNSGTATFTEAFQSLSYIDTKFHVDKSLTIDTKNMSCTLPVTSTTEMNIVSIVVGSESNGTPGDALNNFSNNDLNAILDSSLGSLFLYENFGSLYSNSSLTLALTFAIDSIKTTNSLYVKLYSADGTTYTTIKSVEISQDGISYTDVTFSATENQSDYYIRYISKLTKFVKVTFYQNSPNYVKTDFGTKLQYSIGIRYVGISQIQYDSFGDYVSVPLSAGFPISNVLLNATDVSNNDIGYYVSANNGSRWVQLTKGKTLNLLSSNIGFPTALDISSIRIKIAMRRSTSPNLTNYIDTIPVMSEAPFFLTYIPVKFNAFIGGFMSFGDSSSATFEMPQAIQTKVANPACIYNSQYKVTLKYIPYSSVVNSDGMYIGNLSIRLGGVELPEYYSAGVTNFTIMPHSNPLHSILLLNAKDNGATPPGSINNIGPNPSGSLQISYNPYKYTSSMALNGTGGTFTLPLPSLYKDPSTVNIQTVSKVRISTPAGQETPITSAITNRSPNISGNQVYCYTISMPTSMSSISTSWVVTNPNSVGGLEVIDTQTNFDWLDTSNKNIINSTSGPTATFYVKSDCFYSSVKITSTDGHPIGTFTCYAASAQTETLSSAKGDYILTSSDDIHFDTIVLDKSKYNSNTDYIVSYYHSLDITSLFSQKNNNQLVAPALADALPDSKVTFNYNYQNSSAISNLSYYSPICNGYTVTMS